MMDMGMGVAMMLMMGISALIFVTVVVAAGVWLVRTLSARAAPAGLPRDDTDHDEAQRELRRRYAAGEITREEYLQGRVDIE